MKCDWCDEEITDNTYVHCREFDLTFHDRDCAMDYFKDVAHSVVDVQRNKGDE